MKAYITLLIALLISISAFSQQGINYKAIVKDGSGNIVSNQLVTLQFEIREASMTGTVVYSEAFSQNTDINGLMIVTIGTSLFSNGVFDDIDWGSNDHFLNVKVNTGSGLIDINTTQLMTVPYALMADRSTSADTANIATTALNVNGLEAINEGNGIGWRLKGQDPDFYGNIGLNAVDLSQNTDLTGPFGTPFSNGAMGDFSFAAGHNTGASFPNSIAIGTGLITSRSGQVVIGKYNEEDVNARFIVGNGTTGFAGAVTRNNAFKINAAAALFNTNVYLNNELRTTSTGSANLIPIAYGSVDSTAGPNIKGGTGNFSVTRNTSTNEYTISITGETLSASNTAASISVNTSNFRSSTVTYSGGNAIVNIFTSSFVKVASPFQFVIYKE